MANDRITQDEFLKGVQKQRSLIRKLLAGERRRTEVLTELARQRYGWMIGKFFNAGSDSWWHVSQDSICYIKDIKASAKNVFNDEVHLHMEYQVVEHACMFCHGPVTGHPLSFAFQGSFQ
jgi:hypothetical protein